MANKTTKVEESIHEETERIKKVKKIVKERSANIDYTHIEQEAIAADTWKDHAFSSPEKTIRLATVFSGIGAIEHAFARLKLRHQIVFAGDVDTNCKKSYESY